MNTYQIEESLSSIINEDEKNLSSSSKGSESENLEAIRKFIQDQEKEIQERKSQEREIEEINQAKTKSNEEIVECSEGNDKSEKEDHVLNEHNDIASSVLNMILSESEAKIAEKSAQENAQSTPKVPESTTTKSDQKNMTSEKGNASMPLTLGSKVEVKDFGDDWYPAEIAEVDYEEVEVLVRYEADYKKPDEWIDVSSPRLRPFTGSVRKPPPAEPIEPEDPPKEKIPIEKEQAPKGKTPLAKENILVKEEIKEEPADEVVKLEEKPKIVFEVGERCLARWRDNRRFCATIQKDLGDGNFEIMFDDGFSWKCGIARLHKMKVDKSDSLTIDTSFQSGTAGSPSPIDIGAGPSTAPISPILPFHTHLFDPSTDYLCSKSERREKKRKLNIKEIFNIGQKKTKIHKTEKEQTPKTPTEKKPRVVKQKAPPRVRNVIKKEIKAGIPDAVASIIGTITKEVEIKLEQIDTSEINKATKPKAAKLEEPDVNIEDLQTGDCEDDKNKMAIGNLEPIGGVVNPNDKTMDDEDVEEPKSEGDSVLEEEMKLENFEQQDTQKHEEVLDKIKEAIIKLEGGISEIENRDSPVEKIGSPKEERVGTPKAEIDELRMDEVKTEDLKDVLAEVAATMNAVDETTENDNIEMSLLQVHDLDKSKASKSKRDPTKIKKGKKLRLLQEKKVKRQVQKVQNELEQMKRQFEEMRKQMLVQTQEFAKDHDREYAPLPESFLLPGEWACKWVNGQPVGKVSEVEGPVTVGVDNKPSLPRRSVEVEDKRLPPGWSKHMVRRSVGNSAGKWDVVLVSPDEHGNKRFHTKTDMRNFLETNPDPMLKEYSNALTDFGVHLKISRRMGWIVNTPDGIAEAPETILPAGSMDIISPLVKRRNLNLKKRIIMKERKRGLENKKRRPIKLKLQKGLHTYNSQLLGESSGEAHSESVDSMFEPALLPLEDGYVYVGSLKVQIIDNLLRCPAEGCVKNFRTKTLLQMHIKHYHRELTKMMGATPKVLDLAYARTMPNDLESQQPDKKIIKVKINKPPKREEPKMAPESEMAIDNSPKTPEKIEDVGPSLPKIPRSLDSPKLRQALIHKPVKRPRVLLPVRRLEPEPATSDSINDDVFENQVSEPLIEVPTLQHPLDFETAISTHTVTKPLDKKKKKSFAAISKTISEDEEWFAMNSDELDTRSSFPRSGSPDSKMDSKTALMSSESNDDQKDPNLYTLTESGERIKIVHMKREEIINCHCGVREEDGLMVQCELCLCWQHALCHNIQRECEVPEKYTCSICLNPRRGRRSQRFLHDQDRLYEGLVAGARPCDSLRRSHELAGNLLRIHDALHALRLKYYVAAKKDHPKLYLWAADWEQAEITYTQEKLNSDYSDLSVMINGMDKENLPVKQDDEPGSSTPPSDEQEADRLSQRDHQLGSQSLLSGLLSSPGGASLDLPISTSELERLAKSVQESAEWQRVTAPQPEAAIENEACRERLLRHIQRCQTLIDTRLDSIEAQVAELESQDPSFGEHYETAEFYPRTKQTIQMLMRDLDTMEELGVIT